MEKLAVTRGGAGADFGWFVQPYHMPGPGWWRYDKAVVGPFPTRREARKARRRLLAAKSIRP